MNGASGFSPRGARAAVKRPRSASAQTVERVATARLPTEYGEFRITGYRSLVSGEEVDLRRYEQWCDTLFTRRSYEA